MEELSDEDLAAAVGRDPAALGPLVSRYWRRAYGLAYQITRDAQGAEDAAQAAFVRLLRAGGYFQEGRPFRPWFLRIVANSARDLHKAGARRRRYEERAARPSLESERPEGPDGETLDALARALDVLDADQRTAIALHYLEGMTFREVAETLDCPPGTAASRVRRGLDALRGELKSLAATGAALALLMKPALAVEPSPAPSPARLRAEAEADAVDGAAPGLAALASKVVLGATLVGALATSLVVMDSGAKPPARRSDVVLGSGGDPSRGANAADGEGAAEGPRGASSGRSAGGSAAGPAGDTTTRRFTVRVRYAGGPQEALEVRFCRLIPGDGSLTVPGRRGERLVATTNERGEVQQDLRGDAWELSLGPPPGLDVPPGSAVPFLFAGRVEAVPAALLNFSGEPLSWSGGPDDPQLLSAPTDSLTFELSVPPLAIARGRVLRQEDDGAIPDATVNVGASWRGRSNAQGAFAIPYPAADSPGGGLQDGIYVGARAPGFSHSGDEASSADLEVGVTLRLNRGVDLRGVLLEADGRPAAGYHLELGSSEGLQLPLTTDGEGRFSAEGLNANRGLGYAAVYVTVMRPDLSTYVVDLLARSGREHTIRLPAFHTLRGTVLLGGRPIDQVGVALFERSEELREVARGATGQRLAGAPLSFAEAPPPPNGLFSLDGLEAGPRWLVIGPFNDPDFSDEPAVGVNAWRVDVPRPNGQTFELQESVDTPVRARHAGGPARDVRVRVFPAAGAPPAEVAPTLRAGYCDDEGGLLVPGLGRGVTYDVVADLPDGRRVVGLLRGGDPCELLLPGLPLPAPAQLRFEAVGPDDIPLTLEPEVQVYAVRDPSRPLLWKEPAESGLGLWDDPAPRGQVPAVGDAWIVIGDWGTRATRRVTLSPGATLDLGRVRLEMLPAVPLRLIFDPDAVRVYQLVLEWKDPVTGAPQRWDDNKVYAPGTAHQVRLPKGQVTVGGYWRAGPSAPKQTLSPQAIQVEPGGTQPLELRLP